jgi:SAM-dependent methyltransferase
VSRASVRKKQANLEPDQGAAEPGADAASLYDRFYFEGYRDQPYERSQIWLQFFSGIADRIVRDVAPTSVLDAGCAMGFLVEALRDRSVEAYGVDVSDYAIANVRPDIRSHCWRGSLTDPLPRRYDLIVCLEVLEHLSPADGERAVENLCAHTDDIIFSSTPTEYKDATHVNVRPPEYWAMLFGGQGFFRDVDFDLSYLSPQAARFRRGIDPIHRVLAAYERLFWQLKQDSHAMHQLAAEQQRELARLTGELEARQAELEAVRGPLTAELEAVRRQLAETAAELDTRSYRAARALRLGVRRLFPEQTRRGRLLTRAVGGRRAPPRR